MFQSTAVSWAATHTTQRTQIVSWAKTDNVERL